MKKNYVLWFALWAFFLIGCRNDNFNPKDTNNQQALKFRIIPKSEIPNVISYLQTKTDDFKIPLKRQSTQGKTETLFGEVITEYIVETINSNNEVYYTFPIIPKSGIDPSDTYNLSLTADNNDIKSSKIIAYEPTDAWILNGNNDLYTFSGIVSTYNIDGSLESTVAYINGTGNCNPEPCPDCPTNPQGPGGGGGGGGLPPGTSNPPPTGSGGPISYPNTGGGDNPPPSGPTTTSGGGQWVLHCEDDENGELKCWMVYILHSTTRLANPCPDQNENGGVIITTQNDPCTITKSQLGTASVKEVIQNLKNHITSGAGGEKGYGIKKNGTASPTTENNDHSVNFGDPSLLTGGYHNHTGTGVDIFSAKDISTLIEIARYNGSGKPTYAFMGLVAPNGIHYIIRFNGVQADIPTYGNFSQEQFRTWSIQQAISMSSLSRKTEFIQVVNGKKILNTKGLEKIFFDTLDRMGLKNNIILQKIDINNKISTVNKNTDGTTIAIPCSQ
ncbi:hypothetical protein [Chryseobacterium sp.]|uniref:hypothetical protein n=1 Tax=Chryseobacterium sp. TaxID=1871047 RepID=UPI0035B28DA8